MKSTYTTLLLTLLLAFGCKEKTQPLPPEAKSEIIPLIHHQAYTVLVDQLRMRAAAGRKTEVLRKLPEGTIVLSDGTTSDFTDEITLRGTTFRTPYHKVYRPSNPDQEGWLYGGALLKVYHQDAPYPFSSNLDGLVAGLLQRELLSLTDAAEVITALHRENGNAAAWNDALFVIGQHILSRYTKSLPNSQTPDLSPEDLAQISEGTFDYPAHPVGRQYYQAALTILPSAGHQEILLDENLLAQRIGGPFSPSLQAYLDIQKLELDQAGLLASGQQPSTAIAQELATKKAAYSQDTYRLIP